MEIILVRHGKPVLPSLKNITASDFTHWITEYNQAGLCASSTPSHALLKQVADSKLVISSTLKRSIESAQALQASHHLSDPLFNEADLPVSNGAFLKLSPKYWAIYFRIAWLFGYSTNIESYRDTKARAFHAVNRLVELAHIHKKVLLVGHGVYNQMLANELRKHGWSGPKRPAAKHWSYAIYQCQ